MTFTPILSILQLSAQVALIALLLIAIPGILCGYAFARRNFPGKSFLETVIMAPVTLPPVALGLILLTCLDRQGPFGALITWLFPDGILLTRKAAIIAAAVVGFPLFARSCQQAFAAIPRELEQAARVFGANPWQSFWHISLPLARYGILHGSLLAFARALGEFGATILVAGIIPGETETLSLAIYGRVMAGDDHHAWILCALALLLTLTALGLSKILRFDKNAA